MPTWKMKFTPLLLFSFSASDDRPAMIEGVCSSSASVKSHCVSAIMRTSLGRAGGCTAACMAAENGCEGGRRSCVGQDECHACQMRQLGMKGRRGLEGFFGF